MFDGGRSEPSVEELAFFDDGGDGHQRTEVIVSLVGRADEEKCGADGLFGGIKDDSALAADECDFE